MKKIMFFSGQDTLSNVKILIIIILVLSFTFRFINLDQKSYWDDEAFTALRISGYTEYEVVEKVSSVERVSVTDLSQYQSLNAEKNLIDTISSLALEEAQHPPLYYVMARFWMQWFGNSMVSIRALAAVISLLALPSIYWLCVELFGSSGIAWLAVQLLAISPFQVLYAQEAREYSLWIVTILLSSASLLKAIRTNTKISWGIYAATLALSLYTFPSSVIVAVAHGVYIIAIEGFRLTQKLITYILASLAGLLAFSPWLLVIITNLYHLKKIVAGQGGMPILSLMKTWAFNLSRMFIDTNHERAVINFGFENNLTYLIQVSLVGLIVVLVGYSIYYLCRHSSKKAWLFILSLILVTSLPIMLKDLIYASTKSIIPRYLIPGYLGIQISVAYLLANKISSTASQQKFGKIMMCALFSGAIFSCVMITQANDWWTKSHSDTNLQAAKLINQVERPLLISDGSMGRILGLSHQLNSQVQLQLKPYCHTCRVLPPSVVKQDIFKIPDEFDVFLFAPSVELKKAMEQNSNYQLQPLSIDLWRINKASNQ
ncbi:glycosyltransferase family 39 protein [Anabaena sp. 4-3]|uniref:glycosyltransferase family 39 protein n=1 Tax=Anabaena sp. 4-3 TaxID=1811979 RepID=UPI0008374AAF|nr:glycosyltransferase family 39 protein [Anabaena sp. 4-3]